MITGGIAVGVLEWSPVEDLRETGHLLSPRAVKVVVERFEATDPDSREDLMRRITASIGDIDIAVFAAGQLGSPDIAEHPVAAAA